VVIIADPPRLQSPRDTSPLPSAEVHSLENPAYSSSRARSGCIERDLRGSTSRPCRSGPDSPGGVLHRVPAASGCSCISTALVVATVWPPGLVLPRQLPSRRHQVWWRERVASQDTQPGMPCGTRVIETLGYVRNVGARGSNPLTSTRTRHGKSVGSSFHELLISVFFASELRSNEPAILTCGVSFSSSDRSPTNSFYR